ncbi:nucleoplasmin-2 isoform X21 [Callithrix jacchus]
MNLSSTSSTEEKAVTTVLWGCELSQERRTWTFRPQPKGKQDCKLLLHTICLGEKAKEEMHRVEILPPGNREDKKTQPVTIASLQASVLPMVTMVGVQLSPPITFQLRAGSGPVFLSGHERYEKKAGKRTRGSKVWWYTPAVPAIREAEAGGSREPGRSRLQ